MFLKRLLSLTILLLCMLLLACSVVPLQAEAAAIDDTYLTGHPATDYRAKVECTLPELSAPRFACFDDNGVPFFERASHEKVKIASVTKIMTAIIAADYPMNTRLTVSEHAASIPGSTAGVMPGDEATFYDMVQGLMLPSGNDAAYALAEDIGGRLLKADGDPQWSSAPWEKRVERFVAEMNKRAEKLDMTDTLFANPCGLDDEGFEGAHVSSAADVAKMTREMFRSPALSEIVLKPESGMLVVRGGVETVIPISNTNKLLEQRSDARGAKTGFTDAAGACFAGAVQIDGDWYYTAVLGTEDAEDSFSDTALLWDWIRSAKETETMFTGLSEDADGNYVIAELGAPEWTDKVFPAVVKPKTSTNKWYWEDNHVLEFQADVPSGVIKKGQKVGTLTVRNESGEIVEEADVKSGEIVPLPGLWERIGVFFTRLFAPVTGARTQASDIMFELKTDVSKTYSGF